MTTEKVENTQDETLLGQTSEEQVDTDGQDDQTQPDEQTSQPDTDTETDVKSDTDTETETVDPVTQRFQELGLDKQYHDVDDMMSRVPETNKHITFMQQENAELHRQLQEQQKSRAEPAQVTDEEFLADPLGSIKKMGYVTKDEATSLASVEATRVDHIRQANDFISATPDYRKMEPAMMQLLEEMPEVKALPAATGMRLLYAEAKRRMPSEKIVEPADPGKKSRASTSGGQTKVRHTGPSLEEYGNMTPEQIEEKLGFASSDNQ